MAATVKMEGLGNMFIVFKGPQDFTSSEVAKLCSQYQTDGLLVVTPANSNYVEMKYWNTDGSAAEMCGNGLRCVTRFSVDNALVGPGAFIVGTDAGPLKVNWDGKDPENIEVQVGRVRIDQNTLTLFDMKFYKANVGNPHAVTFVEDIGTAPVKEIGAQVENNIEFPNKTNVEFVQVLSRRAIRVRTWERGSGETLACGTGMVAAATVAAQVKGVDFPLEIEVLGGTANVWLDDEGFTRMIGPARYL